MALQIPSLVPNTCLSCQGTNKYKEPLDGRHTPISCASRRSQRLEISHLGEMFDMVEENKGATTLLDAIPTSYVVVGLVAIGIYFIYQVWLWLL